MKGKFIARLAAMVVAALVVVGCAQAPAAAPTQAPAPAPKPAATTAPATAPTTAPAKPTAAPAQPTAAPAQPTAAPKVTYPEKGKAITLFVSWPAGGGVDVAGRMYAAGLEKELGVPVQVVNKPDAGGQVGITEWSKAKPDGYMIGVAPVPSLNVLYLNPERKAVFARKDFQPLALHVIDYGGIAVQANSPYKSLKDLTDYAKANPEKVTMTANGVMTPTHIGIVELEKMTGSKIAPVQMTGDVPSNTALLGGQVTASFGWSGQMLPLVKSGQFRMLGVSAKQRSPFYPDVPTFAEQGFNINISTARGYALPAGVPKDIVDVLSTAGKKAIEEPENKKKLEATGAVVEYWDPAKFTAHWDEADALYGPIIKELLAQQSQKK